MTPSEAKTFGRTRTLIATIVVVVIALIGLLIRETRGDFANGILFFIERISNIHFIAILTILFILTSIFGGKAGREIIIDKKNIFLTSIKYIVIIILTIIIYAAIIGICKDENSSVDNLKRLLITYFLTPLFRTGLITFIPMLFIWLWATNEMKIASSAKSP